MNFLEIKRRRLLFAVLHVNHLLHDLKEAVALWNGEERPNKAPAPITRES